MRITWALMALLLVASASAAIAPPSTNIVVNRSSVAINATYGEAVYSYTLGEIFDSRGVRMTTMTTPRDGRAHTSFYTTATLPAGQYTYSIQASDIAGNIRRDFRNFTIMLVGNPGCGDGRLNPALEECDDNNTRSGDGCNAQCLQERCDNNRVDVGEECDGTNLNGVQCSNLDSFTGGSLTCASTCRFDTSMCTQAAGVCGNGVIEPGEQCDGTNWGAIVDCNGFDSAFTGGRLTCNSQCLFDTSGCQGFTAGRCGDGQLAVGEQCDGRARLQCTDFDNFISGSLSCRTDCTYDTAACVKASPRCGDGEITVNETCDGTNWGRIAGCTAFSSFTGGSLRCGSDCSFDTSGCVLGGYYQNDSTCNDRIKNGIESDVDCGGDCGKCADNGACNLDGDCMSGFCQSGSCVQPSCSDGIANGLESDVDCGGSCLPCSNGQRCFDPADCSSGACSSGICSTDRNLDSDGDGMPDWWEERYGLDQLDPSDASDDPDDDDSENLDEFLNGTDPLESDKPRSRALQITLLTIGLLMIIASTAYLVYSRMAVPVARPLQPRPAVPVQPRPVAPAQAARPAPRVIAKKPRSNVRESIMQSFGGSSKPASKAQQAARAQKPEAPKQGSAFEKLSQLVKDEPEDPKEVLDELYKKRSKR